MYRREFMGAVAGLSLVATTDGFISTPLKQKLASSGLDTKDDAPFLESDYYIIQGWDDKKVSAAKFVNQYEEFKSDLVELKTIGINLSRSKLIFLAGVRVVIPNVFVIYPMGRQAQVAAFRSKYDFKPTSHSTWILCREQKLRILPKNSQRGSTNVVFQSEIWRKVCEFSTKINEFNFENEEDGDTLDLTYTGVRKLEVGGVGEVYEFQSDLNLRSSKPIRRVMVLEAGKIGFLLSDRYISLCCRNSEAS